MAVIAIEERSHYRVRVTQGLRSFKKQEELYGQGRTAPGAIVTNSRAGQSFHQYGVAGDICFLGKDPYLEHSITGVRVWGTWGKCAEEEGLEWGGNFRTPDQPHAQITYGLTHQGMHALYKAGGISNVWEAFDENRGIVPGTEWRGFVQELERQGFSKP